MDDRSSLYLVDSPSPSDLSLVYQLQSRWICQFSCKKTISFSLITLFRSKPIRIIQVGSSLDKRTSIVHSRAHHTPQIHHPWNSVLQREAQTCSWIAVWHYSIVVLLFDCPSIAPFCGRSETSLLDNWKTAWYLVHKTLASKDSILRDRKDDNQKLISVMVHKG